MSANEKGTPWLKGNRAKEAARGYDGFEGLYAQSHRDGTEQRVVLWENGTVGFFIGGRKQGILSGVGTGPMTKLRAAEFADAVHAAVGTPTREEVAAALEEAIRCLHAARARVRVPQETVDEWRVLLEKLGRVESKKKRGGPGGAQPPGSSMSHAAQAPMPRGAPASRKPRQRRRGT